MALTVHVDVVSAEKELFSGLAQMVVATAELGEVGILPGHSPLLARLKAGQVRIQISETEMQVFYVSSGLLEVQPHSVTVLAEYAENAVDLDEAAAIHAREAALRAWQNCLSDRECVQTLVQATAQLQAIDRLRRAGSKLGK
ncbi:MAG: F0F1 ATP synthase subunit epsilon [Candidatus Contendobacter sp.]|jgi:F-type H+-transporting ATPase subunit epsilon|nr:F0F1 ATP synthase subunit epsilon [Gammaproteobacteria bacterium]MCC8994223.1 F0F1 ATP synthase subunit epsilon [Candidatus Contendobacter sp.]